jgi:hypothetical protein
MSTDSSFHDETQRQDQTQGSVPSKPGLNPDDPDKYDPLTRPDMGTGERPEDGEDPAGRDLPEADEQTPLSDDRR